MLKKKIMELESDVQQRKGICNCYVVIIICTVVLIIDNSHKLCLWIEYNNKKDKINNVFISL